MAACSILFHVSAFLQVRKFARWAPDTGLPTRNLFRNRGLAAAAWSALRSGAIEAPRSSIAPPPLCHPKWRPSAQWDTDRRRPAVQIVLAIAIIVVVAVQLVDVNVDGTDFTYSCLLGQDYLSRSVSAPDSRAEENCNRCPSSSPPENLMAPSCSSLCTYTFVVCGVSLLVSSVISIIQCCTCNLCGLGRILDVIVSGGGACCCDCGPGRCGGRRLPRSASDVGRGCSCRRRLEGNLCDSPPTLPNPNAQLGALGTVWWAVASGVIGKNAMDPSDAPTSSSVNTARDAVPIMCWIETGIFGVMLLSSIFRVCNCCGR